MAPRPRPHRYNSDSEAVQALATSYVNRGGSFREFAAALAGAHPNSPVGRAYRRRGEERERWARRSWAVAQRFVRARPARGASSEHDDRDVLEAWQATLPTVRLPKSARRAAEALQRLAVEHGRALVGLSVRELAERSGASTATASIALRVLREAGLVELAGAAVAGRAHRYRLRHPDAWSPDIGRTVSASPRRGGVSGPTVRAASAVPAPVLALVEDVSHDAWRARGLGETCRRTYLLLAQQLRDSDGGGLPVAEVANGTDVGERQARRNLNRLATAGLARREPDGRWSAEARDGEEVAEALGVAGRGAEQRRRHVAERLGWRLQRTLRQAGDLQAPGAGARDRWRDRPDRGESVVAGLEGGAVSASGPDPAKRGQSDIEDGERLDEATAASWTEAFPQAASPLPAVGRRARGDGEGAEGATLAAVARHRGPHAGAPELPVAPELAEIA